MQELFEENNEWEGMPEFVQKKQQPYACINIRFETKEDLMKFSETINQKLTQKTKSIWFPEKSHFTGIGNYRWVDDVDK